MSKIAMLRLKGQVYWTCARHPALPLCLDGIRHKKQEVSTGLRDLVEATRFSVAYTEFIRDAQWHHPKMRRAALEKHELAATIFYRPYFAKPESQTDEQRKARWFAEQSWRCHESDMPPDDQEFKKKAAAQEVALIEADATITVLKKELGKALAGSDRPFAEVVKEYLAWGEKGGREDGNGWSDETLRKKISTFNFWQPHFKTCGEITLAKTEAIQRSMQDSGGGNTRIKHIVAGLKSFCIWAVNRNLFLTSPLRKLKSPKATTQNPYRSLTVNECKALVSCSKVPYNHRVYYLVGLNCGCRVNELNSLKVGDFSAEKSCLFLRAAWTKNRKDSCSPLPDLVTDVLRKRCAGLALTDKLLPLVMDSSNSARIFRNDCKAAGIDIKQQVIGTQTLRLVAHSMRVTYATLLNLAGANAKVTQDLMHHSTAAMTAKYVKSFEPDLKAASEAVGALVGSVESV